MLFTSLPFLHFFVPFCVELIIFVLLNRSVIVDRGGVDSQLNIQTKSDLMFIIKTQTGNKQGSSTLECLEPLLRTEQEKYYRRNSCFVVLASISSKAFQLWLKIYRVKTRVLVNASISG